MTNKKILTAILAMALVFGMMVSGCDTGGGGGDIAPTITTTSLPGGTVGTAYSRTLTANGDTPITWSIDAGSLPGGLTLSTAGVISGTPTTANTFNFTVKATNAAGNNTKAFSIVIDTGNPGGGDPTSATYTGYDRDANEYNLVINKNTTSPGIGGGTLDGTWESPLMGTWVLNNGSFTISEDNDEAMKGTYSTSGNNITMTITHIKGAMLGEEASVVGLSASQWYTQQQLKTAIVNHLVGMGLSPSDAEEIYNDEIGFVVALFEPGTGTYTLSGNTLTIVMDGETTVFTSRSAGVTSPTLSFERAAYAPQKGDNYTLTVKNSGGTTAGTSTGTVSNISGGTYTLDNEGNTFTVKINNLVITEIPNAIPLNGGGTLPLPGTLTPTKPGGGDPNPGTGMTWTAVTDSGFEQTSSYGVSEIWAVAYGGGKFVAGGRRGQMAYSSDGASWTVVSNSTFGAEAICGIAYGNNKFVAVGTEGKMAHSANGESWTAISESPFLDDRKFGWSGGGPIDIYAIAFGGGKFVAGAGGFFGASGELAYSADGENWTAVSNINYREWNMRIRAIAYGSGKFVAVGDDGVEYSADGASWTKVTDSTVSDFYQIHGVVYEGGKFVAVGDGDIMAYSANGINWTAVEGIFSSMYTIYDIAYGNNRFVAGGNYGKMAYSTDGVSWTAISGLTSSFHINAIAYGNGRFVAVGDAGQMAYCDW